MPKTDSPIPQRAPKQKEVTLGDVWSALQKIHDNISSHDNKLKVIVNNIKSLENNLKSFSSIVENLSAELKQVKEETKALSSIVQIRQDKVNHLENITLNKESLSD